MDEAPQVEQQETAPPVAEEAAAVAEGRPAERQYCVFRSGRERFCLPVLDIEEVVDWPSVTQLPLAPAFLLGIFNLRGAIVPVVEIAFTSGRRADLAPKRVVVARLAEDGREDLRLGIAADEVIGTYTTTDPLLVDEAPRDVPHCCGMLRHPSTPGTSVQGNGERQDDRLALALDLQRLVEAFPVPVI